MAQAAELRELEDDELYGRLADSRRELLNLRFQLATGQLDNVARISLVKRDVARILTLLRDREIALAEGRDSGPVRRIPSELTARPPRRPARSAAEDESADVDAETEEDLEATGSPGAAAEAELDEAGEDEWDEADASDADEDAEEDQ